MMSDDDDFDYTTTTQSSGNLASIFHGGERPSTTAAATTAYVPPKQPKKDAAPRVMIASVAQAFVFGADQKWTPKGKMGVALLSTENTVFQVILYVTKTQTITSVRINTSTVFTPQSNNYLSFQDDGGQNWSIMFDTKQAIVDFALQILVAKAFLFGFKFDHIIQDIREGEGSALVDNDSAEVTAIYYKFNENGTIQSVDTGDNKPVRYKIGKNQNGKAFDEVLRGMKKNSQRVAMVGTTLYNIEIVRIKREKEVRGSSITMPPEEPVPIERKRTITEDNENNREKNKMLDRINRMGGVSMLPNQGQSSAFVAPLPPHLNDDNDSISNEFINNMVPQRSITTPVPPVQFVQPTYHHHPIHPQSLMQQSTMYPPQQLLHDYNTRPGSSMSTMGYQQPSMWPHSQYPPPAPNVPPTDMFYQPQQQQQPPFQPDVRQLMTRLNEKVDGLNEKFDTKISTTYPNMETSILLANIQRIIKENETVKKDLYDRSAKVEELNSKISELLDRNQRLIEQTHQTAEQRNVVVNNVSEQTAQKILELEKQKVEFTNNLSVATSKIGDLQLQLNQFTQGTNENQSRINSLKLMSEQYKDDLQKSEHQRLEIQSKFETMQEQFKNEKQTRKQLQQNLNTLEEELTEIKSTCASLEKTNNERRMKYENERKRWQDDIEEQKQSYEKELDELRAKLRKQRTVDNVTNNQEISRIEEDLAKEWQEKLDRQQTQHERALNAKTKEIEQLKTSLTENETKLEQVTQELDEAKEEIQAYEERCEKLQERLGALKEKLIEMNDEQPQLINEQVKRAINIIFQRLKSHIQPNKQYTGEQFLTRALEIIKKAALKVLSNDENDDDDEEEDEEDGDEEEVEEAEDENDQQSTENIQTDNQNEQTKQNDEPINGNSINQQSLNEALSSIPPEEKNSPEPETLSSNNYHKYGWDTVDDLPQQSQIQVEATEQTSTVVIAPTSTSSTDVVENNEQTLPSKTKEEEEQHDSDESGDTIEEDNEKPPSPPPPSSITQEVEEKKDNILTDDDDDALFQSARPSLEKVVSPQSAPPSKPKYNANIPSILNPDDSDDELFK